MRIAHFSDRGAAQFGLVTDDLLSIEVLVGDPLRGGVARTGEVLALEDVRLLPPVANPSKIIGIGRNYVAHIEELGNQVPIEPMIFLKPATSLIGSGESIVLPRWSEHVDHEAELAVVIGQCAKDVAVQDVDRVVFGYTAANDVSARDIQKRDGQWARAKGFDTACPLGPWIVTPDGLAEAGLDVADLRVSGSVNGVVKQNESTALMINSVRELISFVSSAFTLLPGDIILTGTPAGVSQLSGGDVVEIEVEGIGKLTNPVAGPILK
ncbi:MAG: fumarylacetoacetate hydrolase family protein [Ancrocorticia sp.]